MLVFLLLMCWLTIPRADAFLGKLPGFIRLHPAPRSAASFTPLRRADQNLCRMPHTKHIKAYSRKINDDAEFESLDFDDVDNPHSKGGGDKNE